MIKKIIVFVSMLVLTSCIFPDAKITFNQPITNPYPVNFEAKRNADVTTLDMTSDFPAYYEFAYDNSAKTFTVQVTGNKYKMGRYLAASPLYEPKAQRTDDGLKVVFRLGTDVSMTYNQIPGGVRVTLTSLAPDADISSMKNFGGWAEPSLMARHLIAVSDKGRKYTLSLDGAPAYMTGTDGGRPYLDIFGVEIPKGTIDSSYVKDTTRMDDRSRIFFKQPTDICPTDTNITFGEKCPGYVSLFGFRHGVADNQETFSFAVTGKPDITYSNSEKMSALGMKNIKFFDTGVRTFPGSLVYKMEFRKKNGMIWMVFLREAGVKFKQSYDDGRLVVVFYK